MVITSLENGFIDALVPAFQQLFDALLQKSPNCFIIAVSLR